MEHHHNHSPKLDTINRAFIVGIILNFAYVIIQIILGLRINSLSLLSDAGHNFLDVGTLALSLLAVKLAKLTVTKKHQY
jgi:cobalt-zinc-cadmium efflux system protein